MGTQPSITQRIQEYVEEWSPRMGLDGFEVRVFYTEGTDLCNADTEPRYRQHVANFNIPRIQWQLEHDPSFDLEEHVVHELAHIFTWRTWQLTAKSLAGKDMQHAWEWMLAELYEETTTRIAWALVQTKRDKSVEIVLE